ncbi:MAG: (2Fe-2S)-binding protein [Desulfobacterales bacterium]|jgi:carbon-monoxide dehydrogenase small subunit
MNTYSIRIKVNREWRTADVNATETLLDTLRDRWRAVEVKNGCAHGDCGACTVLLQGRPVNACLVLSVQANEKEVTTVKGIGTRDDPHPLQAAFVEQGAIQCGYCTPGMIVSSAALLDQNPNPSRAEISEAISGNLCRCTGYTKIFRAVEDAAGKTNPADRRP